MATTIRLTDKGQLTFSKQLMEHIKVKAGEQVVIKKLPDGGLKIEAEKKKIDILSLSCSIASDVRATDEEIKEAIEQAYVDAGMQGLK